MFWKFALVALVVVQVTRGARRARWRSNERADLPARQYNCVCASDVTPLSAHNLHPAPWHSLSNRNALLKDFMKTTDSDFQPNGCTQQPITVCLKDTFEHD